MRKRYYPKKAQITIFMIIGLVLLFIFIFLFMTLGSFKKGQLEQEKEKIFGTVFKKEALRIYVEDCLQDELTQGLLLLGKQGRIWKDQPGGTKEFVEKIDGLTIGEDRIAYALTNEHYDNYPEAYPCDHELNEPAFCQYYYPNTVVGFGEVQLKESVLKEDLKQYLINRTLWCVYNYTLSNLSKKAELETKEIDLELQMLNDGIAVKVHYPITFKVGPERFSHLSEFDFFYPSTLTQVLKTAVIFPLDFDQKYVEFDYDKSALEKDSFGYGSEFSSLSCSEKEQSPWPSYRKCSRSLFLDLYQSLGIDLQKKKDILPNGDDLYVIAVPAYTVINSPDHFVFQFLRQNRPPALNYISRLPCPEQKYDYLVIKGDQTLGDIDLQFNARDADEDVPFYNVKNIPDKLKAVDCTNGGTAGPGVVCGTPYVSGQSSFHVLGSSVEQGLYDLVVEATDSKLKDQQKVRILVDRPLFTTFSIDIPYTLPNEKQYSEEYVDTSDFYQVSKEDPFFLHVIVPESSATSSSPTSVLTYDNGLSDTSQNDNFPLGIPQVNLLLGKENIYRFPDLTEEVNNFLDLGENEINEENNPYFKYLTNNGMLSLSFAANYCDTEKKESSRVATIAVKECVPHRNKEHPFAYPYHGFTFENDYDFTTGQGTFIEEDKNSINPYLATHSCCGANWEILPLETECFTNPTKGCYGRIKDYTIDFNSKKGNPNGYDGYVYEQQYAECNGDRGNICGDRKYRLWEKKLVCGDSNDLPGKGCKTSIPPKCKGKPSWSFVDTNDDDQNDAWCCGNMGCQKLCNGPLVIDLSLPPYFNYFSYINKKVNSDEPPKADEDLKLSSGCKSSGKPCDNDLNGDFEGTCQQIPGSENYECK